MKRRLRETRNELDTQKSLRTIRGLIEYILWYLKLSGSSIVLNQGVEGTIIFDGTFYTPIVETLPAIPTTPETYRQVFWTSAGAGTGDDILERLAGTRNSTQH